MRTLLCGLVLLAAGGVPLAAVADDDIPNLVGRWVISAEGVAFAIPHVGDPEHVVANSEFVIDHQDGFRISGHEANQRASGTTLVSGEEQFAGVIGVHNKTVSMVDENGFRDCDIISDARMECIYRHVATDRAVVTRNTWTKEKD